MPDELLHLPVIQRILARDKDTPGALLPILHAVQHELGYIPDASVPEIAHALNLSLAEVRGVISFYHDFRTAPPARHTLRLCRAVPSRARAVAPKPSPRNCVNSWHWTTTAPAPTAPSACALFIAWVPVPARQRWSWTARCTRASPLSACGTWSTVAGRTQHAEAVYSL